MMKKFETLTERVMPLPMNNVDTDAIIPAQFLTSTEKQGYGKNLFRRLRDQDPRFIFNQSRYAEAKILAVGHNFGCGSSREHAVWALREWGIDVVIGKSFADIFSANAAKNGLLLIALEDALIDEILKAAAQEEIRLTVDLARQKVRFPDQREISFVYDSFRKHCLLHGLDDLDYLLSFRKEIEAFWDR